jgi:hypothetical protein
MLLRHDSPHDRDPDIFHTMTSHNPEAEDPQLHHQDIPTEHHSTANPNFDSTNTNMNNNNFDDVWGDDNDDDDNTPPPPHHHPHHHHNQYTHNHPHQHPPPREISDIPRLSQAHTNAGYRDGITLAKSLTAQQGFDEGYGLGAHIGARAGQLLGVLEGLAAAVGLHLLSSSGGGGGGGEGQAAAEARRIEALLGEARRELSVRGVFEAEYWAGDGNGRYEVLEEAAGGGGGMGGEGVVFSDVAEAHPLLRKWRGIVRGEAARYGVDWEVLKDEGGDEARRGEEDDEREREREREGKVRRERENRPAVRSKEALAW